MDSSKVHNEIQEAELMQVSKKQVKSRLINNVKEKKSDSILLCTTKCQVPTVRHGKKQQ